MKKAAILCALLALCVMGAQAQGADTAVGSDGCEAVLSNGTHIQLYEGTYVNVQKTDGDKAEILIGGTLPATVDQAVTDAFGVSSSSPKKGVLYRTDGVQKTSLYALPDDASAVIGEITGNLMAIFGKTDGWFLTRVNSQGSMRYGFVHASDVIERNVGRKLSQGYLSSKSPVTVYRSADKDAQVLYLMYSWQAVSYVPTENGKAYVEFHSGLCGYISRSAIADIQPQNGALPIGEVTREIDLKDKNIFYPVGSRMALMGETADHTYYYTDAFLPADSIRLTGETLDSPYDNLPLIGYALINDKKSNRQKTVDVLAFAGDYIQAEIHLWQDEELFDKKEMVSFYPIDGFRLEEALYEAGQYDALPAGLYTYYPHDEGTLTITLHGGVIRELSYVQGGEQNFYLPENAQVSFDQGIIVSGYTSLQNRLNRSCWQDDGRYFVDSFFFGSDIRKLDADKPAYFIVYTLEDECTGGAGQKKEIYHTEYSGVNTDESLWPDTGTFLLLVNCEIASNG